MNGGEKEDSISKNKLKNEEVPSTYTCHCTANLCQKKLCQNINKRTK